MIFHYYAYNVNLEKSLSLYLSLYLSLSLSIYLFITRVYLDVNNVRVSYPSSQNENTTDWPFFCNGECHMYSVPMNETAR